MIKPVRIRLWHRPDPFRRPYGRLAVLVSDAQGYVLGPCEEGAAGMVLPGRIRPPVEVEPDVTG